MAGIIRSSFSFILGTGVGVYLAQNYNVPNVLKLYETGMAIAQSIEDRYRKKKPTTDDD